MSAVRTLAVIGSGPTLAVARAIALQMRHLDSLAIELPPEAIPAADIAFLIGKARDAIDVFAAVGLHALNHARADLVGRLRDAGYERARLVHPNAFVDPTATLGENVLVGPHASVGPDCVVEDGVVILDGARIEAGARLCAFAWIGATVSVGFSAVVGAHTILRPGVHLDAGVPVGHHCELAVPGVRQKAVADCTLESNSFDSPVRIFRGGSMTNPTNAS